MCDETQNLNETESETFFRYQIFPIPNPILLSIPFFFDTESDTFFRYRIRYFFQYQIFRYRIRSHQKNRKVPKQRSFETETSHSGTMINDYYRFFCKRLTNKQTTDVYFIIGLIVKRTPSLCRTKGFIPLYGFIVSDKIHTDFVLTFYVAAKLCNQSFWQQFDCNIFMAGFLYLKYVSVFHSAITLQLCNILLLAPPLFQL